MSIHLVTLGFGRLAGLYPRTISVLGESEKLAIEAAKELYYITMCGQLDYLEDHNVLNKPIVVTKVKKVE